MVETMINADDLGMTPGTNAAIFDAFDRGVLTHASVMANAPFFEEALEGLKRRPGLRCGVHLNLSYGDALSPHPSLCDDKGRFKYGFMGLMVRAPFDEAMRHAIEREMRAQILRLKDAGIEVEHLDSHRHVHLIPPIYRMVVALAKRFGISRIRLVKENPLDSLRIGGVGGTMLNGGLFKYVLLNTFSRLNRRYADLYDLKFYSILHTGGVTEKALIRLLQRDEAYEVMVHPGYPEMDEGVDIYDENERDYRMSGLRRMELLALLGAADGKRRSP